MPVVYLVQTYKLQLNPSTCKFSCKDRVSTNLQSNHRCTYVPGQDSGFHLPQLRPLDPSTRACASLARQVAVARTSPAFALESKGDEPQHRIRPTPTLKSQLALKRGELAWHPGCARAEYNSTNSMPVYPNSRAQAPWLRPLSHHRRFFIFS